MTAAVQHALSCKHHLERLPDPNACVAFTRSAPASPRGRARQETVALRRHVRRLRVRGGSSCWQAVDSSRSARSRWSFLVILVACALAPCPAAAQAVYGSIAAPSPTPAGAALPGVTVTVTSVERKTSDTVVTNESGLLPQGAPAARHLRGEGGADGFKTAVVPTRRRQRRRADEGRLQARARRRSRRRSTVTGAERRCSRPTAPTWPRPSRRKQITELPILDRNFTKFILLTPGTQQLGWSHAASENPQGSVQTMVNGQHFSGTGYQLDGTENRDPILGIIVINPNLEAIGETKITSQNYDAEFGQAIAGVVSVQTKSGTNELHGSAFEFRQSDKFQARNPFTQFRTRTRSPARFIPETKRDQFGGSIGGPIIKNQLVLLRRLPGHAQHTVGGSQAADRADARPRAHGRPERVRRQHLRPRQRATPGRAHAVRRQRHPDGPAVAAGAAHPAADPAAQRAGHATTARATTTSRQGSRRSTATRSTSAWTAGSATTLNMFGRYSFADFALDGPTAFGAGGGPELVEPRRQLEGAQPEPGARLRLHARRRRCSLDFRFGFFQLQGGRAADRLRHHAGRRTPASRA